MGLQAWRSEKMDSLLTPTWSVLNGSVDKEAGTLFQITATALLKSQCAELTRMVVSY